MITVKIDQCLSGALCLLSLQKKYHPFSTQTFFSYFNFCFWPQATEWAPLGCKLSNECLHVKASRATEVSQSPFSRVKAFNVLSDQHFDSISERLLSLRFTKYIFTDSKGLISSPLDFLTVETSCCSHDYVIRQTYSGNVSGNEAWELTFVLPFIFFTLASSRSYQTKLEKYALNGLASSRKIWMQAKVENERLLLFPRLSINNLQNAAKKCYKCVPHVLHDYSLFFQPIVLSFDIDSLAFPKA